MNEHTNEEAHERSTGQMNERMHVRTKLVNAAQTYARTKSMNEHTDVSTNKVNERTYGRMNESSDGKTDE